MVTNLKTISYTLLNLIGYVLIFLGLIGIFMTILSNRNYLLDTFKYISVGITFICINRYKIFFKK